jgi:cell cycle protein kinase DBF2
MAPEIMVNSNHVARVGLAVGYDHAVDYWSLGCILFEFLAGYPPFAAASIDEVWINVFHWQEVLDRPQYTGVDAEFNLSNDAWDCITGLIALRHLRIDSVDRMRVHPWFAALNATVRAATGGTDWDAGLRAIDAVPFVPSLKGAEDHSHFDDFTDLTEETQAVYKDVYDKEERMHALQDDGGRAERQHAINAHFVGFSHRHAHPDEPSLDALLQRQ